MPVVANHGLGVSQGLGVGASGVLFSALHGVSGAGRIGCSGLYQRALLMLTLTWKACYQGPASCSSGSSHAAALLWNRACARCFLG